MTAELKIVEYAQSGVVIKYDDDAHKYLVNDQRFPSVTTLLKKHVAKDEALLRWSENLLLEGVIEFLNRGQGIPSDPVQLRHELWGHGLLPEQERDRKGDIGKATHDVLENYAKDGTMPEEKWFDDSEWPYVQGLAKFLLAAKPRITGSEVLVASLRHRFAGRYDARMVLLDDVALNTQTTQDGKIEKRIIPAGHYLVDLKTSNSLYPEVGLQLAAYEQASIECGFSKSDGLMAIHVKPDGTYAVRLFGTRRGDFNALARAYHAFIAGNKATTKLTKKLAVAP